MMAQVSSCHIIHDARLAKAQGYVIWVQSMLSWCGLPHGEASLWFASCVGQLTSGVWILLTLEFENNWQAFT